MTNLIYFLYDSGGETALREAANGLIDSPPEDESLSVTERDGEVWLEYEGLTAHLSERAGNTDTKENPVPDVPHGHIHFSEEEVFLRPFDNSEILGKEGAYLERIEGCVAFINTVFRHLDPKPDLVYGLTKDDWTVINEIDDISIPVTAEGVRNGELSYVPWLVIATERLIDTYGRETLRDIPAWRVEDLPDGSLLLVAYSDLLTHSDDHPIPRNEHLGIDLPLSEG